MSATAHTFRTLNEREGDRARVNFLGALIPSCENLAWFLAVFIPAILGGWWLVYVAEIWVGDALSRVNQAFSVVLGRDPHLGAIGFIWPPLPSLLEIPFVAVIGQFGPPVMAGQILSAAFSGGLAVALNRTLDQMRVPVRWRIPLVAVTMLNPLIVYSAINGMTENIFLFFIIIATSELMQWKPGEQRGLLVAALCIGLGFLVRYEAVAFAGAGIVALIVRIWSEPLQREHLEALLTTFVAPISYCIAIWVMWNALFAGDPLFFLTGSGSNTFYTAPIREGLDPVLSPLVGHPIASFVWSARRVFSLSPAFLPALIVLGVRSVWKKDRVATTLVGMAAVGVVFEYTQIARGQLLPMHRFWIYPAVFFPLLIAQFASPYLPGVRSRMYALGLAGLFVASGATLYTMAHVPGGEDERLFSSAVLSGDPRNFTRRLETVYNVQRATADIINDLHTARPDSTVLIDGLSDWSIQLFVKDQGRLISDRNRDHASILDDPIDRVNYILIREPGQALPSPLLLRFPTLYRDGAPWASYVAENPEAKLRLFRVLSTAEQAQGTRPVPPPR